MTFLLQSYVLMITCIPTHTHTHTSIYWEHYYSLTLYPSLVPSKVPRIIDPANPSNNLYDTGIGYYCANEKSSDFEHGDGDWTAFKKNIHTVDLTKPLEHWLWNHWATAHSVLLCPPPELCCDSHTICQLLSVFNQTYVALIQSLLICHLSLLHNMGNQCT